MVEQTLWRLLEYDKNKQAVIIVTIVTGLVLVWPAADVYIAAVQRVRAAQSELEETQQEVEQSTQLTQILEARSKLLSDLEQQTTDETESQLLRSQIVQIVRQSGCRMRQIRLQKPMRRVWLENDHPVTPPDASVRGGKTPFHLVTRQLSISISGQMGNIHQFLKKLDNIQKFVHTRSVALKRADARKSGTTLDVELILFDLVRKTEA